MCYMFYLFCLFQRFFYLAYRDVISLLLLTSIGKSLSILTSEPTYGDIVWVVVSSTSRGVSFEQSKWSYYICNLIIAVGEEQVIAGVM